MSYPRWIEMRSNTQGMKTCTFVHTLVGTYKWRFSYVIWWREVDFSMFTGRWRCFWSYQIERFLRKTSGTEDSRCKCESPCSLKWNSIKVLLCSPLGLQFHLNSFKKCRKNVLLNFVPSEQQYRISKCTLEDNRVNLSFCFVCCFINFKRKCPPWHSRDRLKIKMRRARRFQ